MANPLFNEKAYQNTLAQQRVRVGEEMTLQGTKGRFGILPNHINIVSALDIGITKILIGKLI